MRVRGGGDGVVKGLGTMTDLLLGRAVRKLRGSSEVKVLIGQTMWLLRCHLPTRGRTGEEPVLVAIRPSKRTDPDISDWSQVCEYKDLNRKVLRDGISMHHVTLVMRT